MAAFVPLFSPTVQYRDDVTVELPDPPHLPDDPIIRPGVARYAGRTVVLIHVESSGTPFELRSPVRGVVRRVDLPGVLLGTNQLLEIEPLPFQIAPVLKALPPGSPTFYLAFQGGPGAMADGELLEAGSVIESTTDSAYAGVLFQDGAALSPWAWIELLGKAMQDSGDAGAGNWNTLLDLYAALPRTIRALDHDGRPAGTGVPFNISVNGQPPVGVTTGSSGEIILAPGAITLSWQGSALAGDTPLPVQSLYERTLATPNDNTLSAPPNGQILLTSDFQRGHVQLLDLSRWYSVPPFGSLAARHHTNCRMEPLVDGIATYKRIVDDLVAARGSGGSAYFSGLIFNNFDLDKGRIDPLSAGAELDTSLVGLTKYIRGDDGAGGGEVRMLMDKWVELNNPDVLQNTAQVAAYVTLLFAASAITFSQLISFFRKNFPLDEVGFHVMWGLVALSSQLLQLATVSRLEQIAEPSMDVFEELNLIEDHIALWARYPVSIRDNPLADEDLFPVFKLVDIQERIGFWHQKIQAIKRSTADVQGNHIIGFVGGLDINKNRLDTPGHQTTSPYHDVQCRVTGTAAWDIHTSWRDAFAFAQSQYLAVEGADVPGLTSDLPDYRISPQDYPDQPQKHIVQIGRTYFRADASNGSEPLPFAVNGEKTTYETYLRAIKAAKSYIHVEDQYFTPNSSPDLDKPLEDPPGDRDPNVVLDALLDAATHCKRLVVMIPREGDQPFGQQRRAFVIAKLREAWGDRVFVGVPLRRPFLPSPGRVASVGRTLLLEDIAALSNGPLIVGPPARIPSGPVFWLWIYGELMLCTKAENTTDAEGSPAKRLTVVRGGTWGSKPRTHKKGAPVTFSQLKGPFVHAKVIVVDDLFVGIGSTNFNRRASFSDGEIHSFAIPEQLRAARDNPALALRTALWAEHLGIPPAFGAALLADPITAFEYFRRSIFGGNRSTTVESVNERPHLGGAFDEDSISSALKNLLGLSVIVFADSIWNTVSDPPTDLDPRPLAGPFA